MMENWIKKSYRKDPPIQIKMTSRFSEGSYEYYVQRRSVSD